MGVPNFRFNGKLTLTELSNAIEKVEGVEEVNIKNAWAKFGAHGYSPIDEYRTMDAGYARLDEEATAITYKLST